MKLLNKTAWRTDDLRAIVQRALVQEIDDPRGRKAARVEVVYSRGGGCSGVAQLRGMWCRLRIPHPHRMRHRWIHDETGAGSWTRKREPVVLTEEVLTHIKLQFASVAVHEFAHNRGMAHRQMPKHYTWKGSWQEKVAWVRTLPLRVQEAPARPSADARLAAKHAHVLVMLARAETRAKRAATLVKKWRAKARYYDRKLAARTPQQEDTHEGA